MSFKCVETLKVFVMKLYLGHLPQSCLYRHLGVVVCATSYHRAVGRQGGKDEGTQLGRVAVLSPVWRLLTCVESGKCIVLFMLK